MIQRDVLKLLENDLGKRKALILLGARQVGKTTLLQTLSKNWQNVLWLIGDELETQKMFENPTITRFKAEFSGVKFLIIDEAQRLPNVGLGLKLITDHLPHIQLLVTGSSAFELSNRLNESLMGRTFEHRLYPVSFSEMADYHTLREEKRLLPYRLVYGYYPDVVTHPEDAKKILQNLTQNFLYKDMLLLEGVKKPDKIIKLLQALAFQVGSQVSYNELGRTIGMNTTTVEKYITMLEQSFVLFRLSSFSRNLRTELSKSRKIYFYDNGIRNALIGNFNSVETRADTGALWENFLISERLKLLNSNEQWTQRFFWRTTEQQEIDYVEEENGILSAFEFKWSATAKAKISKTFTNTYPNAFKSVISPENFETFVINLE
ncbi:MAG: ATP-binding protein [Flavobacteriaceae bacterium]|jgi:predicted AAA+ superfamily ATPase|nr:ATP-binding protein [Flavobacteriaceae bacterium]